MAIAFEAMPGPCAEVPWIEETSRLVLTLLADDVVEELEFDLGVGSVVDPAVRDVDVLPSVVVKVCERRTPKPARRPGIRRHRHIIERPVAAVAEQVVARCHLLEDVDEREPG